MPKIMNSLIRLPSALTLLKRLMRAEAGRQLRARQREGRVLHWLQGCYCWRCRQPLARCICKLSDMELFCNQGDKL